MKAVTFFFKYLKINIWTQGRNTVVKIQIRREWVRQNTTVFVSYLLGWQHVSATVGHPQVTKLYNEEKIYSIRTLIVVQILSFPPSSTSPTWFFSQQSKCTTYIRVCTLNSRHFTHKTSLTTCIYTLSLSTLPLEYIISFNIDNRKTTRSRWKLRIGTTTNVLILYIFSSLCIFVTWGWPTVAETCRQPN